MIECDHCLWHQFWDQVKVVLVDGVYSKATRPPMVRRSRLERKEIAVILLSV